MIFKLKPKKSETKKQKYKYNVRKRKQCPIDFLSHEQGLIWLLLVEDYASGYPKLAAFFDSDDQFSVYRRFGYLHSRLLLYKQDELRELEDRL